METPNFNNDILVSINHKNEFYISFGDIAMNFKFTYS